jgi:RNAse (barnase) inhibitor barstar
MDKEYVLDGTKITSLEAFYDEIGDALAVGKRWGRNLDALDDVLSGGDLGIPDDGFILTWAHSEASRNSLGAGVFERLVEVIRDHESNVRLILA